MPPLPVDPQNITDPWQAQLLELFLQGSVIFVGYTESGKPLYKCV
jgi:hypothetical protein